MITIGACSWVLDTQGVSAIQRSRELGFTAIELLAYSMDDYNKMRDPTAQAFKDIEFKGYILSHIEHKDDIEAQTAADITKLKHIFEL
jgi:hypothetical protein